MLKVVVLAMALAVSFLVQAKLSPQWTATCIRAECVVGLETRGSNALYAFVAAAAIRPAP